MTAAVQIAPALANFAGVNEHSVEVDAVRVRYLRCGAGPPLILIHGFMGYSFSWRLNFGALGAAASVYAIDLPGMGFSARPPESFDCSMRGLARFVLRWMDAVGLDQANVLGTSHGGAVAMMMSAEAPVRIARLVLAAPVNPWSPQGAPLLRALSTVPGAFLARCSEPLLWRSRGYFLRRMYGDPRRVPAGSVEGYGAALRVPGTLNHLLRMVKCWLPDLRQLEPAIACLGEIPTLLVWGSRDPAVYPESSQVLLRHLRRAELVMLDGMGHLPYEEAPDQFNEAVLNFLSRRQAPLS